MNFTFCPYVIHWNVCSKGRKSLCSEPMYPLRNLTAYWRASFAQFELQDGPQARTGIALGGLQLFASALERRCVCGGGTRARIL